MQIREIEKEIDELLIKYDNALKKKDQSKIMLIEQQIDIVLSKLNTNEIQVRTEQ